MITSFRSISARDRGAIFPPEATAITAERAVGATVWKRKHRITD